MHSAKHGSAVAAAAHNHPRNISVPGAIATSAAASASAAGVVAPQASPTVVTPSVPAHREILVSTVPLITPRNTATAVPPMAFANSFSHVPNNTSSSADKTGDPGNLAQVPEWQTADKEVGRKIEEDINRLIIPLPDVNSLYTFAVKIYREALETSERQARLSKLCLFVQLLSSDIKRFKNPSKTEFEKVNIMRKYVPSALEEARACRRAETQTLFNNLITFGTLHPSSTPPSQSIIQQQQQQQQQNLILQQQHPQQRSQTPPISQSHLPQSAFTAANGKSKELDLLEKLQNMNMGDKVQSVSNGVTSVTRPPRTSSLFAAQRIGGNTSGSTSAPNNAMSNGSSNGVLNNKVNLTQQPSNANAKPGSPDYFTSPFSFLDYRTSTNSRQPLSAEVKTSSTLASDLLHLEADPKPHVSGLQPLSSGLNQIHSQSLPHLVNTDRVMPAPSPLIRPTPLTNTTSTSHSLQTVQSPPPPPLPPKNSPTSLTSSYPGIPQMVQNGYSSTTLLPRHSPPQAYNAALVTSGQVNQGYLERSSNKLGHSRSYSGSILFDAAASKTSITAVADVPMYNPALTATNVQLIDTSDARSSSAPINAPGQPAAAGSYPTSVVGLTNLGNSCFLNSVLQCIYGTGPFVQYMLSGNFKIDINLSNKLGTGGRLAYAFHNLVQEMSRNNGGVLAPVNFRDQLAALEPRFTDGSQQDFHEFLGYALDKMHEDLKTTRALPAANSLIEWLFFGTMVSVLRCLTCNKEVSTPPELFSTLSVPVPTDTKRTKIESCIAKFLQSGVLEGDNMWSCPDCKKPVRAIQGIRITRLPRVLVIALNRFRHDSQVRDKIDKFVDFPLVDFDLTAFVDHAHTLRSNKTNLLDDDPPPPSTAHNRAENSPMITLYKYNLYAVNNHFGTLDDGHYTATVRHPNGIWYNFDDARVTKVPPESVVTSSAYTLFYTLR